MEQREYERLVRAGKDPFAKKAEPKAEAEEKPKRRKKKD